MSDDPPNLLQGAQLVTYLPTRHLPALIRGALRAARVRPMARACYATATKLVTYQREVPLLYVEGWAIHGSFAFGHAWVRHAELGDVDLLLDQREHAYQPLLVMGARAVARRILAEDCPPWAPPIRECPFRTVED